MILTAFALLLQPLPAAAEDWREALVSAEDKATAYVDVDSITEVDGKRKFRIKLIQEGVDHYVVSTDILDCKTQVMDAVRMELWKDGKFVSGDDFPIGKYHYEMAGDPSSAKLVGLVCAPLN